MHSETKQMDYENMLLLIAGLLVGILITIVMPKLADKFCSVNLSEEDILRIEERRRRNNRNLRTGSIPAVLANMTEEERSKVLLEVLRIQPWSSQMPKDLSSKEALEMIKDEHPIVESSSSSSVSPKDEENQNTLPQKYEKEHEDTMCAICMEDYKQNDEVTIGATCSHMYHKDCLLHWMSSNHDFCPYCREYFFDVSEFSSVAERLLGSDRYNDLMTKDDPTVVSLYATSENTNTNTSA